MANTVTYKAPFAKCDREKNYEIAWTEFERRGKADDKGKKL